MAKNDMKMTKSENALEAELRGFLNREFPDFIPASKSWRMLDSIAPALEKASQELLRERILNAAAKLPLAAYVRDINGACEGVRTALGKHSAVEQQVKTLQAREAESVNDENFDPLAASELSGQISSLNRWLAASSPLQSATERLREKLDAAARALPATTRPAGKIFYFLQPLVGRCHRHPCYVLLAPIPSANATLKIAKEAVAEMLILAKGEIPVPKNPGCQPPWGATTDCGLGLQLPIE
jgi:hypothetical protein